MNAFAALADPIRREVVTALAEQPRTVNEIVALFNVSQPAISRHLRVLREAGLVQARPDGQTRVYSLNAGPLRELDEWLQPYRRFWAARLDALDRFLEEEPNE